MKLRRLVAEDLGAVVRWSQDEPFCRANGWELDRSEAVVRQHWSRLIEDPPKGLLRLGAAEGEDLVGYADLANVKSRAAELGFAIGGSDRWGQGLGTAVATATIEHAFQDLELNLLRPNVHESNNRSLRIVGRLGFLEVGVLPDHEEYMGERVALIGFELKA